MWDVHFSVDNVNTKEGWSYHGKHVRISNFSLNISTWKPNKTKSTNSPGDLVIIDVANSTIIITNVRLYCLRFRKHNTVAVFFKKGPSLKEEIIRLLIQLDRYLFYIGTMCIRNTCLSFLEPVCTCNWCIFVIQRMIHVWGQNKLTFEQFRLVLVSAMRIFNALARWRSDVAIFILLSNKTSIPISHSL